MVWLKHFTIFAKPTKENSCILILDGHNSHKTLQAIDYANRHGINIITIPPHCTQKKNLCDRTFFKPLKSAYKTFADSWMASHPGQQISYHDMAGIFAQAYNKFATVGIALKGFTSCGF